MGKKTALVVGATGLERKELINLLLTGDEYEKIIVWGRRPLGIHHPKLIEREINFEMLDTYDLDEKVDDLYCCLGTTIKKAGTQKEFRKVDFLYPIIMGRKAKKVGLEKVIVISAMGASIHSSTFYSRIKGEMEEGLMAMNLSSLHILRPSLLLGKREEFRMAEGIGAVLTSLLPFIFRGFLKKYKPITGKAVAYAMYQIGKEDVTGNHIYESDGLVALSKT